MSSKRRIRRRSCEGKVAYATQTEAARQAGLVRRAHQGGQWSAYHCDFCGKWHVGRPSARQRQAMRDRRAALAE